MVAFGYAASGLLLLGARSGFQQPVQGKDNWGNSGRDCHNDNPNTQYIVGIRMVRPYMRTFGRYSNPEQQDFRVMLAGRCV